MAGSMLGMTIGTRRIIRRDEIMLPLIFLLLHGAALMLGGKAALAASFGFLIAAPALAGLSCLYRGWKDEPEGWVALGAAMLFWAAGMAAQMLSSFSLGFTTEESLGMVLFVLYGVPLIFALASPENEVWYIRAVDAALSVALGYLFYVHVFRLTSFSGPNPNGFVPLRLMLDIENLYIALFTLARLAASGGRSARFARTAAAYAVSYMVIAAYINHFQDDTDFGHWPDLLIDLPFLLLFGLAAWRGETLPQTVTAERYIARVIRAGSPLMLLATLLTVSILLVPYAPAFAVAGCIVATAGFGLRMILVQLRNLDEQDRLARLSHVDALTGVANRRMFDEMLRRECARARREGDQLAVLMIDIDHFKMLNDHFGHAAGDARLRDVAQALVSCARRNTDLVARYGGEEFAAILSASNLHQALAVAEMMRATVESLALESPASGGIVTISIGLAHAGARAAPELLDMQALLGRADAALYDAKKAGRNRIVLAGAAAASKDAPAFPPSDEFSHISLHE